MFEATETAKPFYKPEKLIRDKTGERISASPEASKIRRCADEAEYDRFLAGKIIEEARELAFALMGKDDAKVAGEAGDLSEVLELALRRRGIDSCIVAHSRLMKARKKGRFNGRYLLALDTKE